MQERLFSNSELALFKDCRRRWYLSHYRRLRPVREDKHGARSLGTNVHEALGQFYDPNDTDVVEPEDVLAVWDRFRIVALDDPTLSPDDRKAIESDHDLGRAMLEGYFEWLAESGADVEWEVIGSEVEVSVPFAVVNGVQVILIAKLDLRVRNRMDGRIRFMDNKTVQSIKELPKRADIDEQFLHYGLIEFLLHQLGADADSAVASFTDGGVYNMLRKVKRTKTATPPFFDRYEYAFNVNRLRSHWYRIYGEVEDVLETTAKLDRGDDHRMRAYANPTRDCDWKCEFRSLCPMLDDSPEGAEAYIAEAYEVGDPLARYDNFSMA